MALVRGAVRAHVLNHPFLPQEHACDKLAVPGACFVTLRKNGALRGCIGTLAPTRPTLAEELVRNAVSAASQDPRFPPVLPEELEYLEYSLYLLGEPEPVSDESLLDPLVYGVVLSSEKKRGVLLPGIPGIDTVEQQLRAVRKKAGIPEGVVCEMMRFVVQKFPGENK